MIPFLNLLQAERGRRVIFTFVEMFYEGYWDGWFWGYMDGYLRCI